MGVLGEPEQDVNTDNSLWLNINSFGFVWFGSCKQINP